MCRKLFADGTWRKEVGRNEIASCRCYFPFSKLACNYARVRLESFSREVFIYVIVRSSSLQPAGVIIGVKCVALGSPRHLCAGIIPVHAQDRVLKNSGDPRSQLNGNGTATLPAAAGTVVRFVSLSFSVRVFLSACVSFYAKTRKIFTARVRWNGRCGIKLYYRRSEMESGVIKAEFRCISEEHTREYKRVANGSFKSD